MSLPRLLTLSRSEAAQVLLLLQLQSLDQFGLAGTLPSVLQDTDYPFNSIRFGI